MICDSEKPLCIAGVLGGLNSGVTNSTRTIFLESAYFNPITVRKTAKRHGINTDASFRFERGININDVKYALMYAAILIENIAGGIISSDIIDIYPKKHEDFQVFLTFDKVNKVIGQTIPSETIKNILHSLDIKVSSITERGLGLIIPSYRVDVQREADVIEEILRVYGYNNVGFSEKINASMSHSSKFDDHNVQNIIASQLTGQGFFEIMTNSLIPEKTITTYEKETAQSVKILNPLSNDLSHMRTNLLYSGLEIIEYNINRKRSDLKLFEFGKTYHLINGEYSERKHLMMYVTGNKDSENWNISVQKTDFFLLKGWVDSIFERLGLTNISTKPLTDAHTEIQEGFQWFLGDSFLGTIGVVKTKTLKDFGIKQEVLFADIDWNTVLESVKNQKIIYKEIAKFPEVRRDLALLLDSSVSFGDIYKTAYETETSILKSLSLFDVYQGDKLPEGKKSYAISFSLQDTNKTLTDKQIDKSIQNLLRNFEEKLGASLRES